MSARAQTVLIALGGLALFAAGFALLHGREARASGSWDYVIDHDDEYAFWVIADGFADSPPSDANPFYAEHAGVTNPFLAYPTAAGLGRLAAALGLPVLAFLPAWKVGVPFLNWVALWWCLVRFWRQPVRPAAAVAMLALVSTLLLHGSAQFGLLRFPRPGDSLWLAAICLSAAHRPEAVRGRIAAAVGAAALGVFLLSPYHAVFCTWSAGAAGAWRWLRNPDRVARVQLAAALAGVAVGLLQLTYLSGGLVGGSGWMRSALDLGATASRAPNLWSLALLATGATAVWMRRRGGGPTAIDRALLCTLAFEPLAANVQVVTGQAYGFDDHRYYVLVFEVLALTGWLAEAMPERAAAAPRPRWEVPSVAACGGLVLLFALWPAANLLRLLPRSGPSHGILDNSRLLLELAPALVALVWLVRRCPPARRVALHPPAATALIAALAVTAFATRPSQLREYNADMPFAGAHAWLRERAAPGEVVLSLPTRFGFVDYVPLHSAAKVYYGFYGSRFLLDPAEKTGRRDLYYALYLGVLDRPGVPVDGSLPEKLRRYRLDYILAAREPVDDARRRRHAPNSPPIAGPVDALVERQLAPFLEPVYADDRCVLWRVRL